MIPLISSMNITTKQEKFKKHQIKHFHQINMLQKKKSNNLMKF